MRIKKLINGTLVVPKVIERNNITLDIVVEISPRDPDYAEYMQQYENEQKMK